VRVPIAARLLRGFSAHAPTASGSIAPPRIDVPETVRATIARSIAQRDLRGALAAALDHSAKQPEIAELVAVLARLVAATEKAAAETAGQLDEASTVPLLGHALALFQLRMGNLADAERTLRKQALQHANDHLSQERLADVITLRRALDPSLPSSPPPAAEALASTPVAVLDKKARRSGGEWGAGSGSRPPVALGIEEETGAFPPEQEAELLLKMGRVDRALEIYRRIARADPTRDEIVDRIHELEAKSPELRAPIADESTVRRDLSGLSSGSDARRSLVAPETEAEPPQRVAPAASQPVAEPATPQRAAAVADTMLPPIAGEIGGVAVPVTRVAALGPPDPVVAVVAVVAVHRIVAIR
jgi:hypothetical protein